MVACSRPSSVVPAKSGDVPRIEMALAWPSIRCVARPGRRARLSAMLTSGSLPMSSAEIASTMSLEVSLILIALWILPLMPVTTTVPRSVAAGLTFFPVAAAGALAPGLVAAGAFVAGGCWVGSDTACADAAWLVTIRSRAVAHAAARGRMRCEWARATNAQDGRKRCIGGFPFHQDITARRERLLLPGAVYYKY